MPEEAFDSTQPDRPDTIFALHREPETAPDPEPLVPVAPRHRIAIIDVLRGIAVLGIFLINMPLYVAPASAFFEWEQNALWPAAADRLILLILSVFAQGKFYTIFSFLFGVGFGVQMIRAAEHHSPDFLPRYIRRLITLLAIGLLHFTLVWWGDVLHIYALLGFLLILLRHAPDRTLLLTATGLTAFPFAGMLIGGTVEHFQKNQRPEEWRRKREAAREKSRKELHESIQIKSNGSFSQILQYRLQRDGARLGVEVGWSSELFAGFVVGYWAARRRILQEPRKHLRFLKALAWIGLPASLSVAIVHVGWGYLHPGQQQPLWRVYTGAINEFLARPAIAAGYVAIVLLMPIQSWMFNFAAVGRMALTNYLFQSLVFTSIANSYGYGMFGQIQPSQGVVLCIIFFVLQLILSIQWLRHFRYGPAEWLWRSLTYGMRQP